MHAIAQAGGARLVVVALGADAVSSAVDGILLWRGSRWARWVVLAATGLPLPWRAGCAGAVHDARGIGPRSGARTADGRPFETDGLVAVVELTCDPRR